MKCSGKGIWRRAIRYLAGRPTKQELVRGLKTVCMNGQSTRFYDDYDRADTVQSPTRLVGKVLGETSESISPLISHGPKRK